MRFRQVRRAHAPTGRAAACMPSGRAPEWRVSRKMSGNSRQKSGPAGPSRRCPPPTQGRSASAAQRLDRRRIHNTNPSPKADRRPARLPPARSPSRRWFRKPSHRHTSDHMIARQRAAGSQMQRIPELVNNRLELITDESYVAPRSARPHPCALEPKHVQFREMARNRRGTTRFHHPM
jgi:hypothetical protein